MEFTIDDNEFRLFKDFIYEKSGIYFSEINRAILENRLFEVMLKFQYKSVLDYYNKLLSDPEEVRQFLDLITTNLTKFFRNMSQFEALEKIVIPEIAKRNDSLRTIRIWSAGCSSGEEPYSIAAVVAYVLTLQEGWDIKIVASDISLKSLMIAKEGYYKKDRVDDIPPHLFSIAFEDHGDTIKIKDEIKKLVTFDYHNLKNEFGYKDFDIIFCRNVIIYFDQEAQKQVIEKFYKLLKPYGYLFLGHSESLFGMNTKFKFSKIGNAIVYLKDETN